MDTIEEIAPGIRQIDTLLGGMDRMTAGFLVAGAQPALVETGSQTSAAAVRDALFDAGVGPRDLRWLIVTHVHLDHAGAVGDLAREFPSATVIVHERGARHLIDPTRLVESAGRVYGPLLDGLYGRLDPVPADRLVAAADGFRADLGDGQSLLMVDSPGHAKHHHAVLHEATGTLMVGDAVGVRLPDIGVLRPATPPPDFDLDQAVASLARFREIRPVQVALTHYGLAPDPEATLLEAEDVLHQWVDVAEFTMAASEDGGIDSVAAALADAFAAAPEGMPPATLERFEVLNGVHSNAAGIVRYLSRRNPAAASPADQPQADASDPPPR